MKVIYSCYESKLILQHLCDLIVVNINEMEKGFEKHWELINCT